jgi:ABC-type branched-subunit amino acid transport system substrate-binding protein
MKPLQRFFRAIMMVCLVFCLIFPMTLSSEAQAKPEIFDIAMIGDLTGPYGSTVGPANPGIQDAVEYVNNELGGIDGVKIKAHIRDNKGEASLGLQQYAELATMKPKPLFLVLMHVATGEALPDKLVRDGIIGIGGASLPFLYPVGNTYGNINLLEETMAGAVWLVRNNWREKRNPRAAILTWDHPVGRCIVTPEFSDYLKELKVDLVSTELFGLRDVDVTTQMVRIRSQTPDWLLSSAGGGGYMAVMKSVKELGLKIQFIAQPSVEAMVKVQPQLFEGTIFTSSVRPFDDMEHPGIKKMKEYIKKNNRSKSEEAHFYILAWQCVLMVRHVVKAAVGKVGWGKLDVIALKNEMNKLKNWMFLDGVSIITYTEGRRSSPWVVPMTVADGKLKYLLDPKGKFIEVSDMRPAKYR